ncbi:MAG: trehalase family glycosidase [Gemmatimonadales bacterium]|jgi:hypothetical protein
MADPLQLLERTDKFYLGSGSGIIFAPRFPRWLEYPGFWDDIDVYHYQLAPLFTVTLLSEREGAPGPPVALRQLSRRWSPAELVCEYRSEDGLHAWEHRSVVPGGWFVSEWSLHNSSSADRTLLAVAWTVQDADGIDLGTVEAEAGAVRFRCAVQDLHIHRVGVDVVLEAPIGAVAGCVHLAERSSFDPHWEFTPFPESWRRGLETYVRIAGVNPAGALYAATVSRVRIPAGGAATATLRARVRAENARDVQMSGPLADHLREHAPPPPPIADVEPPVGAEPGAVSRVGWTAYFRSVPELSCSDPYIERYWYYRWYGLQLCSHEGGVANHPYPGCCEGTGYFHVPIAYSAQCHARELRWLPDPAWARGVILNFLAHQKESGQFHGRIYVNHLAHTDFYFANWGDAVLEVDAVHPDDSYLRAVYDPLARYAEWLARERDADDTGLYDVIDHFETGQEYMSRYMAVSDEADSEAWGRKIRLKGVDATVYAYQLQRALAAIAERLGNPDGVKRWENIADRTGDAIMGLLWDEGTLMFHDIDPQTMQRTQAKAAIHFYPFLTDLVGPEQVEGLRSHLLNPEEFWTIYPVPSSSVDDPYFSPDAEWKGKRHNCPWNGRVWPMANSHVAEALARVAIEHDPGLRDRAVELIRKFIRMLFQDGDLARPNCYEHYNPETGTPCLYRGFDDYQHSWVNDLIVKYVIGFRPGGGGSFVVDPFPFEIESFRLARLPFRGHQIGVEFRETRFRVRVDGEIVAESWIDEPVEIEV